MPEKAPERLPAMPHLIVREAATAALAVSGVFLLSALADAPLGEPANPGLSPNPTKAPWYFAGVQELLLHLHPLFAVFIVPAGLLLALALLPYLRYPANPAGIWFASSAGRRTAAAAALLALVATPALIVIDALLAGGDGGSGGPPATLMWEGVMPTAVLLLVLGGVYRLTTRRFGGSKNEAVQALFVTLAVAFFLMTVTCVWFRGGGMRLAFLG
jgi:hypothetical protein